MKNGLESENFYCKCESSGASAKGCLVYGLEKANFKVFKGSVVSSYICDHMKLQEHRTYYKRRLKLQDSGVIESGVFQTDYTFSSPSAAATVVLGSRANGNTEWRTADGRLLGDVRTDV